MSLYITEIVNPQILSILKAHIGACQLLLLTSHLESTADYAEERKRQLQTGFKKVVAAPSHVNAIFAGDLNLRDKEVVDIGLRDKVLVAIRGGTGVVEMSETNT